MKEAHWLHEPRVKREARVERGDDALLGSPSSVMDVYALVQHRSGELQPNINNPPGHRPCFTTSTPPLPPTPNPSTAFAPPSTADRHHARSCRPPHDLGDAQDTI